jgi:lipoprotein Spr
MDGNGIVARARALVGVRFRPQGRSPAQGLDCIGLAALASEVPMDRLRRDYALRSSDPNVINAEFDAFGFLRIAPDEAEAGDLLVVRAGPAQLHIVILTPGGFVHADAGLRRVVETPGTVPWPVAAAWRHPDHEAGAPPSPSRRRH